MLRSVVDEGLQPLDRALDGMIATVYIEVLTGYSVEANEFIHRRYEADAPTLEVGEEADNL